MKRGWLLWVIGIVLWCALCAALNATDWATIIRPAFKQVVRLEMLGEGADEPGVCTGVVIHEEQGYILTAAHCIDKPQTKSLSVTANGRHADVVKVNTLLDLAVLKTTLRGEKQMLLAESTPDPGTPIAVIGYAFGSFLGRDPFVQFGHIAQTKNSTTQLAFLNADVIGGDSGGPCFDAAGKLVALNARLYPWYSAGLAASAPVEVIKEFADPYLPKPKP